MVGPACDTWSMADTKKKGRFSRSWELAKLSWRVVNTDRGRLRFPIMSFVVGLVIQLVTLSLCMFALTRPAAKEALEPATEPMSGAD